MAVQHGLTEGEAPLARVELPDVVEQMLDVSLSDPALVERFRDAAVDLLTRPVFREAPQQP